MQNSLSETLKRVTWKLSHTVLSFDRVSKSFGALAVLNDLSLDIHQGDSSGIATGLIGPNGAGKTTVFNIISGLIRPDAGKVWFNGMNIATLSPDKISRLGIARTFQIPQPFANLTAEQNLMVAALYTAGLKSSKAEDFISQILRETGLSGMRNTLAKYLPLLDRKRLELARALCSNPKLLLMDEVAGGLTEEELPELLEIVKAIRSKGISTIIIEHSMRFITEAVDRILVIDAGSKLAEGSPDEIISHEKVIEAYLGKAAL